MGRGRQKAKHTKVARDLKYFSPDTNYGALQKELGNGDKSSSISSADAEKWPEYAAPSADDDQYEDIYADVYGDDDDDDEDDEDEGGAAQRTA